MIQTRIAAEWVMEMAVYAFDTHVQWSLRRFGS